MRHGNGEVPSGLQLIEECRDLPGAHFPQGPACLADEMGMLFHGRDVVLLSAALTVTVDDQSQGLERVERPVDGRPRDLGIGGATALQELGGRDVTRGCGESLEDRTPLRRPPKTALAEQVSDRLRLHGRSGTDHARTVPRTVAHPC